MFGNGIPNCVPEYYRSMFEDETHEYELEMKRYERHGKNREYRRRKKLEGCAELSFYPEECVKCPCGEDAPAQSDSDDIPTMICSNWKSCPVFRREMDSAFPDNRAGSEDSWVSWLLEDMKNAVEGETKGE